MNTKEVVARFLVMRNLGVSEDALVAAMDATPIEALPLWEEAMRSLRLNIEDRAVSEVERLAKEEEERQQAAVQPFLPKPASAPVQADGWNGDPDIPPAERKWTSTRGQQAPRWVQEEVFRMDEAGYGSGKIFQRFGITYSTQKQILVRLAKERMAAESGESPDAEKPLPYQGRGLPPHVREQIKAALRQPGHSTTKLAQQFNCSQQTIYNIRREMEEEDSLRKMAADAPSPAADPTRMPDWAVENS